MFKLYPFIIPLMVGASAQIIKIVIDYIKSKKIITNNFFSAGGFPSVHSSLASSVTTLVYLQYGLDSIIFAIAFIFTFLFLYDAINIRYEAGKHAKYINNLKLELTQVFNKKPSKVILKERLGHTPIEVIAGIFLGIILTIIIYKLNIIG